MNILFFHLPVIVPTRGGIERVTFVLAEELEREGHHCFFLASLDENQELADLNRQYYLPNLEKIDAPENFDFYKNFIKTKNIDLVIYQAGYKKFPWEKFDGHPPLICSLHADPCDYEAIVRDKIEFKLRKYPSWIQPILAPVWSFLIAPLKIAIRRAKIKRVYRWNYEQCDAYIVLSSPYCKSLERHLKGGDKDAKISFIPNPCSYSPNEKIGPKEKILLYVGRLCIGHKRPDLMLEIWERIEKEFPEWSLEILGDGADAEEVKAIAREKRLERVRFRGFTSPEPFFRRAPFLCMTSSNEGFPMVLLEASSFGCVPIAFDAFPTARDIITDGENGILIKPLEVDTYAEVLRDLMNNKKTISTGACLQNAKRYSLEAIVQKWLKLK